MTVYQRVHIVRAAKWEGNVETIKEEFGKAPLPIGLYPLPSLTIHGLDGDTICNIGDYIVKEGEDDFYAVKQSIFEENFCESPKKGFVEIESYVFNAPYDDLETITVRIFDRKYVKSVSYPKNESVEYKILVLIDMLREMKEFIIMNGG